MIVTLPLVGLTGIAVIVTSLIGSPAPAVSAEPPLAWNTFSVVVVVALTETASVRASTGSFTPTTVIVTVAAGEVVTPSVAVNVNESVP